MPSLTSADGRTLAWRERGSGPALLCHPGGPGFSSEYFGDLPELAARRTLLLLDPRGTGGSDPPGDPAAYALADYADDVEAVREHLGLERLDVLGHSHGGFVAMSWGGAHPEHVGRLVLAGATPRFSDAIREARARRVASHRGRPYFEDAMQALVARQRGEYRDGEELMALYRREAPLLAPPDADVSAILAGLGRAGINDHALRHFNERIAAGMDLRPQLERITAPTLVIAGDQDAFVSAQEEIAAALPNGTLVVLPGLDHFPFLEGPEERALWSRAVLDFLARPYAAAP